MPSTTDHGIAISGSSTGTLGEIVSMGDLGSSIVAVDDTTMSDSSEQKIGGAITAYDPIDITVKFDSQAATETLGTSETWTITHKLNGTENVAANTAGTGFLIAQKGGDRTVNPSETVTKTFTLVWDGVTPPAFTIATTP